MHQITQKFSSSLTRSQLEAEVSDLEDRLALLPRLKEQNRQEILSLCQERELRLAEQQREHELQMTQLLRRYRSVDLELDVKEREIKNLHKSDKERQLLLEETKVKLSKVEKELRELQSTSQDRIRTLEAQLALTHDNHHTRGTHSHSMTTAIHNLRQKSATLQTQRDELRAKIATLRQHDEALRLIATQ